MARVDISANKVIVPGSDSDGLNFTDAARDTFAAGADNGFEFDFKAGDKVFLRSPSGAGVFTIQVSSSGIENAGGTVTPPVINVALGKEHCFVTQTIHNSGGGKVRIDCDVATGEILIVSN